MVQCPSERNPFFGMRRSGEPHEEEHRDTAPEEEEASPIREPDAGILPEEERVLDDSPVPGPSAAPDPVVTPTGIVEADSDSARRRILQTPPSYYQDSPFKKYMKPPVGLLK